MSEHRHSWWWNEDEATQADVPFVCEDGCDATIDGVEVLDILNDREELLRDKAALEAKLEACLRAKSKLYPPGAKYLNNPDNINDPRMIDGRGEIVEP